VLGRSSSDRACRTPQRARIGSIRIELQHLVVELSRAVVVISATRSKSRMYFEMERWRSCSGSSDSSSKPPLSSVRLSRHCEELVTK
jgi:hypothetical protein